MLSLPSIVMIRKCKLVAAAAHLLRTSETLCYFASSAHVRNFVMLCLICIFFRHKNSYIYWEGV